MRIKLLFSFLLMLLAARAAAQREVTPVESDDKKPAAPVLHYFDKHGQPLAEPVLFIADLDTLQSVKAAAKPLYPRLHAIDFGLNFFDGILAIAGQKHGGADVWASLSLWNWIFPTVEAGFGVAKNTPNPGNFTYKGKFSPYFKLGLDYNFLYKSNPQYKVFLGLRAAYSTFTFDITDITISSPYWQQASSFSLYGGSAHAFWGEVLAGLKVNIFSSWSLGWTFRYKVLFNHPKSTLSADVDFPSPYGASHAPEAAPWYIPGYGSSNSHFGVTLSIIYTLPLSQSAPVQENSIE